MISIDTQSDRLPPSVKSRKLALLALALPLILAMGCATAAASAALPLAKGVYLLQSLDCAVLAKGAPEGTMIYSPGLIEVYARLQGSFSDSFLGLMIEKVDVTGQTYNLTMLPLDGPSYNATTKTLSITISDDKNFASADGQQRFRWCAENVGE